VHQRIAPGHAHRHQVGVEFHLPGQRGVGEIDGPKQPLKPFARHPQHAGERPGENGNADVQAAHEAHHVIEPIAGEHNVADDAVGGVD